MLVCFGEEITADKLECNDRFIEEALELTQALGYTAERAHLFVEYVFGRPIGEPHQEVGGVCVTLAALCNAHHINQDECADEELTRIWTKVAQIREKQKTKAQAIGDSPLPAPVSGGPKPVNS